MGTNAFHFSWEFRLPVSREDIWPYIANTNKLNADVGQPAIDKHAATRVDSLRRRLRFSMFGVPVEWTEEPFEWVYPQRYGIVRHYSKGPMTRMRVLIEFEPMPEDGCLLRYQVWATPNGLLGRMSLPVYIGVLVARRIKRLIPVYADLAAHRRPTSLMPGPVHFAPGGQARLLRLRDQLLEQRGVRPELLARLVEVISQTDEVLVSRLRPYELADAWDVPRRPMLELFLRATSLGMLDFHWELLCPMCRNSNEGSSNLGDISSQVHCESCHIDYNVNFDQSVELTFRPNQAIRHVKEHEFCVGGPTRTPHIIAQQILAPGEEVTWRLSLEAGRYQMRILHQPGCQYLRVHAAGAAEATLVPDLHENDEGEIQLANTPTLHLMNSSDGERVFILERTAWSDQAVTAAEVTALQLFRSLFSSEALRPGERISVGSVTIVFTDLRGSTRLYREIGDAPAFGRVMNHFDVLREAVSEEGGGLVKTIGDAVMAVFPRPLAALRAMLQAQHVLANPPDGMLPLRLKAGIHSGPCIAVTLNERLDYFGSTINMAARLEGLSSGQDVIITQEVRSDPEVDAFLHEQQEHLSAEPFTRSLKGFDAEEFHLWRLEQLALQQAEPV
jgi:class 3 adenylate cyclase